MEIDVARAIEEVLDQRKAVHIQGFGSLILEDTPAAMSADALKIEPPSTKLRFYETKTKNGPLRKHLMYRYDLDKEAAQKVIKKYNQSIVNTLLNYNEVTIKGVAKIKKVETGYKLKPKKSFINKYYGGLPVIDLPQPAELTPEKTAIVKPLASAATVSGAAAIAAGSSSSDTTKPKVEPTSLTEKVVASNPIQEEKVEKKPTEKTIPNTGSKLTPPSKPSKSPSESTSNPVPQPKSEVSTKSAKAELSKKVETNPASKYIRQPAKHAVTNKPIDTTTPIASPKVEAPVSPKVDKPTSSVPPSTSPNPVTPPKPAPVKVTPAQPLTSAQPKGRAEKPVIKADTQDKSISSVSKPQALTLNEKLALTAEGGTKKATSATASVAQTTAEIKEKYNIKTPATQTGPTTPPPPTYQDEGFGCRGPLIGLLAFILLFFLLYKGCNMISSKSSEKLAATEKQMTSEKETIDEEASDLIDVRNDTDGDVSATADSDMQESADADGDADRLKSCVIITGVFSRYRNVEKMENLLESRGYEVYMEDYGPYTRVGLEYDCANEDLVDYIQKIRRSIPNASKAWYLKPELHVDY